MSKPFYRFCIFNGIGLALFIWAFMLGYVRQVFEGDVSHISYLISALFIASLARASYNSLRSQSVEYLSDVETWLVVLGLIGNCIGFVIALRGIDVGALGQAEGAQKVGGQLLAGLGVAFYSTLTGSICALWLAIARKVA
jgi:hypothetical protein